MKKLAFRGRFDPFLDSANNQSAVCYKKYSTSRKKLTFRIEIHSRNENQITRFQIFFSFNRYWKSVELKQKLKHSQNKLSMQDISLARHYFFKQWKCVPVISPCCRNFGHKAFRTTKSFWTLNFSDVWNVHKYLTHERFCI